MENDRYSREDLSDDLGAMVNAGILEIHIREDGEWVYSVTERIKNMTDEEREAELLRVLGE